MAAINAFGQYASPEDEYAALYGHLNNPGANNPAMFMPAFDPAMMPQGTTQVNPGAGTGPTPGMPFDNMASSYPYQTVYNGPQAAPQVDPPAASAAPPAAPPAPQYATNMGMTGAENVGGVGMYTGANAPLDTTRFNPQSNLDFVRNIDQVTYYKYVLPFQQRGGDITNQAAVRQAIENGLRQSGGGTYAVGSQTFNVARTQPTPTTPSQPNNQPVQYSGPQPPLPQQPQPQQPFNPAMAYRLPQPTSPSNPFASMLQNPFSMGMNQQPSFYNLGNPSVGRPSQQSDIGRQIEALGPSPKPWGAGIEYPWNPTPEQQQQVDQYNANVRRIMAGAGQQPGVMTDMMYRGGPQQNPQQIQQMIAMAMAQGALGGGQSLQGYPSQFANQGEYNDYQRQQAIQRLMGGGQQGYGMHILSPGQSGYGQSPPSNQQYIAGNQYRPQQQSSGGYFSSDPGMMQAYYGGGGGGNQPLPQVDFRATYGGQSQAPQTQQTPSYTQSTPQYGATQSGGASASNPWANINNTLPSLSNSYSYGWGRR